MLQTKWIRWIAVFAVLLLVVSGFFLFNKSGEPDDRKSIDPPVEDKDTGVNRTIPSVQTFNPINQMQVTLYFKDRQNHVAPITMAVPKAEGVAKKALESMVEGSPAISRLPYGFSALLPKGTQIKGINILKEQKTAVVDFSKEFRNYKEEDERKIMEAVTWTLTGFPTVDNVQIWVDGKILKEMPVGKTPIDGALNRAMGINIESASGINIGQSTPVTVYFLGDNGSGYQYLVPVTRMVKRTDDRAMAALKQLIAGPDQSQKTGLFSVMAPEATVLNLKLSDNKDLITVNFSDKLLGPDQKVPSEAIQSVILSLTENTGAAKVQILINGKAQVQTTDNQKYSSPVSRPTYLNLIKL